MNELVPPLEPQEHQMSPIPQASQVPFVEGDITDAYLRDALINFTKLMTNQAQVVTTHLVAPWN